MPGWSLPSKSDATALRELTRIGLQDDMTFIGSAAALNRSDTNVESGRLGLNSSRTRSCRQRFATCVGGSHASGMG